MTLKERSSRDVMQSWTGHDLAAGAVDTKDDVKSSDVLRGEPCQERDRRLAQLGLVQVTEKGKG